MAEFEAVIRYRIRGWLVFLLVLLRLLPPRVPWLWSRAVYMKRFTR